MAVLDPFHLHPNLADKIVDPETSYFRDFHPSQVQDVLRENGAPETWVLTEDEREADRLAYLQGHAGDLWVFAYGSLMWDPALKFAEVRRAYAPDHERRFILKDKFGGRGTADRPGLMAALDTGNGCHGLAFRIPHELLDHETGLLWRRERIGQAYHAHDIALETQAGRLRALAFVADYDADPICPDLTWEQQVRFCATGKGFLGTSLEYVQNLATHLEILQIEDTGVSGLLAAARDYSDC